MRSLSTTLLLLLAAALNSAFILPAAPTQSGNSAVCASEVEQERVEFVAISAPESAPLRTVRSITASHTRALDFGLFQRPPPPVA